MTATAALAEGRRGKNVRHRLLGLLRQAVYGRLAGYEDVNDAARLARGLDQPDGPVLETEWLAADANLAALADLSGAWIDRVHARKPPDGLILDLDSSESPTFGQQEGTAFPFAKPSLSQILLSALRNVGRTTKGGVDMATERRTWATERTWAIKGISDRTRAAALEAAHEAGLTVGEWVERVLARAATEARHPKSPAAGTDGIERLNERLRPIEEELRRIAERVAALEEQVGRVAATEPPAETTASHSPAEEPEAHERAEPGPARATSPRKARGPRRELSEEARARIDELHGAGRSIYAISKELDVPYSTVYAHVKKSRGAQAQA